MGQPSYHVHCSRDHCSHDWAGARQNDAHFRKRMDCVIAKDSQIRSDTVLMSWKDKTMWGQMNLNGCTDSVAAEQYKEPKYGIQLLSGFQTMRRDTYQIHVILPIPLFG